MRYQSVNKRGCTRLTPSQSEDDRLSESPLCEPISRESLRKGFHEAYASSARVLKYVDPQALLDPGFAMLLRGCASVPGSLALDLDPSALIISHAYL